MKKLRVQDPDGSLIDIPLLDNGVEATAFVSAGSKVLYIHETVAVAAPDCTITLGIGE